MIYLRWTGTRTLEERPLMPSVCLVDTALVWLREVHNGCVEDVDRSVP